MALSHGAGLMLIPVIFASGTSHAHTSHDASAFVFAIHTVAMLFTMTTCAFVAFRLSGVGFLRGTWIDTHLLWSLALAGSGVALLV
jgi:hypothetical protein